MRQVFEESIMIPQPGDDKISIPLTLEIPRESGMRRYRGRLWLAAASLIFTVIVFFVILFGTTINWFIRPLVAIGVAYGLIWLVRMIILEEHRFRKDIEGVYKRKFKLGTQTIWDIFAIEPDYPHICHFKNGTIGVFIFLEKNVKVGRDTPEMIHSHYTHVANAYKEAATNKVVLTHIDYMSVVGDTDRINNLRRGLEDCSNPDVKDLLIQVYDNLEEIASYNASVYDVYCLTTRGTREELMESVVAFTSHMSNANYLSFNIMTVESIRQMITTLFHMTDFSAIDAMSNSLGTTRSMLRPLQLVRRDGTSTKIDSHGNLESVTLF